MISISNTHIVASIIDLAEVLKQDDEIVSVSIDENGINVLIVHAALLYRPNKKFGSIKSEKPKDYTFIRYNLKGDEILKANIKDEYLNFHHVKFLPTTEILLVCARSGYVNENEIDRNAKIYNSNGAFLRDFIAGDGIKDVKIDKEGNIWTSYFDEGIYGNYGWTDPIGYSGLICWNKEGEKIWEFEPIDNLEGISDCYAMNIDSDNNTWFYYYTEFPLVKLNNSKKIEFWETNLTGSSLLNILDNSLLMANGYYDNNFVLFEIDGNKLKKSKKINFKSSDGFELNKLNYVSCFGSNIGFLNENKVYLTNIREIR